jgi:hypothetical protein
MVLPYVRLAALGAVVSGFLAGPEPARAQSVAALSQAGFPIVSGTAVELSALGQGSGTAAREPGDIAVALSAASPWVAAGVVVVGSTATLVLRDASRGMQASLAVPAQAVRAVGLRAGDAVDTTATDAGTILHKDGRVLAFIAAESQQHLVASHAL